MNDVRKKILGLLILENNPWPEIYGTPKLTVKNSLGNPATFNFPVHYETVPGATGDRMVAGDVALKGQYVDSAVKLVERGATLVSSNCGFTARFQKDIASAVQVPVLMSALLFLPFLSGIVGENGEIGVLTYDAFNLVEKLLPALGIDPETNRLVVRGMSGMVSWAEMNKEVPAVDVELMRKDIIGVCQEMILNHPHIKMVLLECTGMPAFRQDVCSVVKVPVFDILTGINFMMSSI